MTDSLDADAYAGTQVVVVSAPNDCTILTGAHGCSWLLIDWTGMGHADPNRMRSGVLDFAHTPIDFSFAVPF